MRLLYIILTFLFFIPFSEVNATHTLGGGLSWEQIGKDTFRVTATLYRDCNGVNLSATPITAVSNCGSMRLNTTRSGGRDITPICEDQCTRCTNRGCTFKYGIEEYQLTSILIVTAWRKNGCCDVGLSWSQCCRSRQITTGAASQIQYFSAKLNICDTSVNLTSPQWNGNPPLITCLGRDLIFDLGATKRNNSDSLVHSFAEPLLSANGRTSWSSNYSYDKPLYYLGFPKTGLKFPRGIHLDSATGQFMVRPMKTEFTLLTYKVEIYRNGKYVGFMSRETPLIILKCPDNNPPVLSGVNCSNPKPDNFEINVCANSLNQLRICISDKDKNDSIKYIYQTNAPGATIEWDKNDNRPSLYFNWKPSIQDQGKTFELLVTAKDGACPVEGVTSRTYTINVIDGVDYTVSSFADSCYNGNFFLSKIDSSKINCVAWQHNDQTYEPCRDTPYSDTAVFNFKYPGKKHVQLSFKTTQGCRIIDSIAFEPNATLTRFINFFDTSACAFDTISLSTKLLNPQGPAKITWSTGLNTNSLTSSETIKLKSIDSIIIVQYQDSVCFGSDTLIVHVNNPPVFSFAKNIKVCFADNDTFKFEQYRNYYNDTDTFVEYTWADSLGNELVKTTEKYFIFPNNGNYIFTATDSLGCSQTETIMYKLHKPLEKFYLTDSILCSNQPDHVRANNLNEGTIKWYRDHDFNTSIGTKGTRLNLTIISSFALGMEYENVKTGCKARKIGTAYPVLPDNPKFVTADIKCAYDTFTVATHVSTVSWKFENTSTDSILSVVPFKYDYLKDSMHIRFEGIDANKCQVKDELWLQIKETPVSKIFVKDSLLQNEVFYPKPSLKQELFYNFYWEFGNPVFLTSNLYQPTLSIDSLGEYEVKLTVTNKNTNCSTTTLRKNKIRVGWPTALPKTEQSKLQVYPNPFSNEINVSIKGEQLESIRVFNASGKQVLFSNKEIVETDNLIEGIYLLKIKTTNGFYNEILIKK